MKSITTLIIILFLSASAGAQMPKATTGTFVLTNATIETVTNGTLTNTDLLVRDGVIASIGKGIAVPDGAVEISCDGMKIYPGFIDGGTKLGLIEIGMIPQASDVRDKGDVIPQMKALTAVNPSAAAIPVTRVDGVTTALTVPGGKLFPGTAALIHLHGYVPDQMYAGFQGVVLNFPVIRSSFRDTRTDKKKKEDKEKELKKLNEVWDLAVQYAAVDSATRGKGRYYPEMEALLPVVNGEFTLLVEVNKAIDIKAALAWVKDRHISKVVFTGVAEGWRVADEIAKAGIPVVTGPVIAIPSRAYDRYSAAYANAGKMSKAGVKVALRTNDTENSRSLPLHAAYAISYGMDPLEAVKAITINPAEIFGVGDQLGSIEEGKQATLLVCSGDPFEPKTRINEVFIAGWRMPMVSRQTLLYDEFLKRNPGIKK